MKSPLPFYLASRSPRRRELLTQMGIHFSSLLFRSGTRADSEVDETPLPGELPEDYVVRVARAKASYGRRLLSLRHLPAGLVLSADTTLAYEGEIIGKPTDTEDAEAILGRLSGQTHLVLTCVAMANAERIEHVLSVSKVRFRPLSPAEIARYVASGEPMDKAGAYGIQGTAGMFVAHLDGSYTGVMGLPLCETAQLLKGFGLVYA